MNWKFWKNEDKVEGKKTVEQTRLPRVWIVSIENGDDLEKVLELADLYDKWIQTDSLRCKVMFTNYVYSMFPAMKGLEINARKHDAGLKFTEVLKENSWA